MIIFRVGSWTAFPGRRALKWPTSFLGRHMSAFSVTNECQLHAFTRSRQHLLSMHVNIPLIDAVYLIFCILVTAYVPLIDCMLSLQGVVLQSQRG